jgi:hypothetical protein
VLIFNLYYCICKKSQKELCFQKKKKMAVLREIQSLYRFTKCSWTKGIYVCNIIRQSAFPKNPIVYLQSDTDIFKQPSMKLEQGSRKLSHVGEVGHWISMNSLLARYVDMHGSSFHTMTQSERVKPLPIGGRKSKVLQGPKYYL